MAQNKLSQAEIERNIFLAGYLAGRKSMREQAALACEKLADEFDAWSDYDAGKSRGCDYCAEQIRAIPDSETP